MAATKMQLTVQSQCSLPSALFHTKVSSQPRGRETAASWESGWDGDVPSLPDRAAGR